MRIEREALSHDFRSGGPYMKRPPRDFETLRAEIVERFSKMSPRLQQIARFALEHPNEIALQNGTLIASRLGVAPSAMIRFAKALDYRGFSDMQAVFRLPLSDEGINHVGAQSRAWGNSEDPSGLVLLDELIDTGACTLKELLRELPTERVERALQRLFCKLRALSELNGACDEMEQPRRVDEAGRQ